LPGKKELRLDDLEFFNLLKATGFVKEEGASAEKTKATAS